MKVKFFPGCKPGLSFGVFAFGFPIAIEFKRSRVFKQSYLNLYILVVKVHFIFGKERTK